MCRFLLVRSKTAVNTSYFLELFAKYVQKSHTPDGDSQEDGWGIAIRKQNWEVHKSLKPIWEDKGQFNKFPKTKVFVVHARSAGFPSQKGNTDYNQPYISDSLAFVFNGMIRGVNLKMKLSGQIGAQKILSLLVAEKVKLDPLKSLKKTQNIIYKSSRKVIGMNLGLLVDDGLYASCNFSESADYFTLWFVKNNDLMMVSSQPFGNYNWKKMYNGQTIRLQL